MLIANSQGNSHHDARRIQLLRQRRVDGFILSLADEENSAGIAQLRALDRPFVLLDREVRGLKCLLLYQTTQPACALRLNILCISDTGLLAWSVATVTCGRAKPAETLFWPPAGSIVV